ncbi:hypothetical protein [Propionibacterium freudenreichii]|nr:hypothetical protein [Propionibacterium freudenreichii]
MLMLPLRAWLMGSPDRIPLLVALTGSRTAPRCWVPSCAPATTP